MKRPVIALFLLVCLMPLGIAFALEPETYDGTRFHMEDGVIYLIGAEQATAFEFLKDATEIIVRAEVEGLPVVCGYLNWSQGNARSIRIEDGVKGLKGVKLAHFPYLETVNIQTAVCFDQDDFQYTHMYLLACPALTKLTVRENSAPYQVLYYANDSPELVVELPPFVKTVDETSSDSYIFTEETHPGETICIVPEGMKSATINSSDVLRIELPASLLSIKMDAPNVTEITVSDHNPKMAIQDGVLYSRDFTELLAYPSGRQDEQYTFHPNTTWVASLQSNALKSITLPINADFEYIYGIDCPNLEEVIWPVGGATPRAKIELMCDGDDCEMAFGNLHYLTRSTWANGPETSRYSVDEAHTYLTAIEGMLYTKDGSELLRIPPTYTGKLTIPEGTKRIAPYAAAQCFGITTLVLPASLEKDQPIEGFFGPSGLIRFEVSEDNPNYQAIDGVLFTKDGKTMLARPASHGTSYVVPAGTEHIGPYAFLPNKTLEDVRMPSSVMTIGEHAFQGNRALISLNLSPMITEIGDYAFENCYKLEKLVLPKGLTRIGEIVGFSEAQEMYWYEYDAPDRLADVTRMEIWIPGTISSISNRAVTYSWGSSGRTSNELLLVVEIGSEGEFLAHEKELPYCYPDQIDWARNGFSYAILTGEAGTHIETYETPDDKTHGRIFPEGTALMLLNKTEGFYVGKLGDDILYVPQESCHVVRAEWPSWSAPETHTHADEAIVYEVPSRMARIVDTVPASTKVHIYYTLGPWCLTSRGYMLCRDLRSKTWEGILPIAYSTAISAEIPVYGAPALDAPILSELANGTPISPKYSTADGWMYIPQEGFIPTENTRP